MVYQDLVLDREVRDWVLLPLTLSIILMKLLQQYAVKVCGGGCVEPCDAFAGCVTGLGVGEG